MHFTSGVQPWALASYPQNLPQLALSSIISLPPPPAETSFPFTIAFSFFADAFLSF